MKYLFLSVLVAMVSAMGCGGTDGAPVRAGASAVSARKQPPPESDEAKANKAFAKLSKKIDAIPSDKTLDPAWLQQQFEAVLAIDPSHGGARFNLAVLKERAGKKKEAQQQWRTLYMAQPSFAPAAENVAVAYVEQGKTALAMKIYRSIIAVDSKNITSRLGLARLLSEKGEYKEAIDLCRKVLQRQGDALEAFRVMAKSYLGQGDASMAELILARGLKVDKNDVALHYMMAQILRQRDALASYVDKLKEIVRMRPQWLKARAELAGVAMRYRDYGNAAQQYEAVLKQRPSHHPSQVGLAVAYKGLGRYEQAEKIYHTLLRKDPTDLDALWNLGSLYHRQLNRYDEAVLKYKEYARAASAKDKNKAKVKSIVATIRKMQNDRAAETERIERERKKVASIEQACEKLRAGKPASQEAEAIGTEQERVEVAWQLMVNGQTAIEAGNVAGGEGAVACAFGVLPNSPSAKTGACAPMKVMWTQILYQLGRLDDAVVTIEDALVCDPNNPDAQLIKGQLAELIAQKRAAAP